MITKYLLKVNKTINIKREDKRMVKKIAFINSKGGVGKTTSLFNIAGVLASKGNKILVVDLDRQCNSTDTLLMQPECGYTKESKTVFDWLTGKCQLEKIVKKSYFAGLGKRKVSYQNIDVIPSDERMIQEEKLRKTNVNGYDELVKNYDYVLIDMPPASQNISKLCFEKLAQYIIVPFSSDIFSVSGYENLINGVEKSREINPELYILGVFFGRFMSNCAVDNYLKEQLQETLGDMLFETKIPLKADIRETIMFGRPISYYKVISDSKKAYEKLAEEIENKIKKTH